MAKNVIITKTARKKLVQARAGIIALPKIVGMAFGSGGVNSKGEVVPPTDNQTTLTAEMYRKKIDGSRHLNGFTLSIGTFCESNS